MMYAPRSNGLPAPRAPLGVAASLIAALAGCGDGAAEVDAAPEADAAPGAWSTAPAVRGGPIQETAVVALDGRIYVIGGFDGQRDVVFDVRVFDVATETWSDGPPLPRALHHANAAVVGDTIHVLGGLIGDDFSASGQAWAWTPTAVGEDAGWQPRAAMPLGSERGAAVTAVIDGIIYVAGGFAVGAAVADVSAYDPVADSWNTDLPALPSPRDHACGGAVDGRVVVAGGRRTTIESISRGVFAFTPPAPGAGPGAWVTLAPLPTARGGAACAVIDDRLIVAGGEGNPDAGSGVFAVVEAYAAATDTWTSVAPMPTPRHGTGAAAWDGRMYIPGGADSAGFDAVATHEVLQP